MVSERQFTQVQTRFFRDQKMAGVTRLWPRMIGLLLVVLLAGESAFGDLLVQPMLVRRTVQPGRAVTVSLNLQNMDPRIDETITLSLKELTQSREGSWLELNPADPNLSKHPLRSCRSWITIPPDPIPVGAYKIAPFSVRVDVPAATRGFYFAALVAATAPRAVTDETGVVTQMNFEMVVPIVLEVQSIPMRHEVSLTDVGLTYQAETTDSPAVNYVSVDIANPGGTFSTIMPVVRLWGQSGGHWRKVSEFKVDETGILPGVTLQLKQDVGRLLAPGPYRVEGCLYVDGRRCNVVQKQIMFTGDPRIVSNPLLPESPLDLQPQDTFLEVVPGATRSAGIQVVNGSEEGVTVQAEFTLPANMKDKSNGRGVRGDDLSCVDWVTVEPRQFTMKGYSRTNLRVMAKMPKGAAQYPCYYGMLRLHTSYRDGQPAGTTETYICIQNKQVVPVPAVGTSVLTISETSPSRFMVVAGYINGGESYVTPSCRGVLSVAGVAGTPTYKQFLMGSENYGQKGIMLPFETRSFSGILDLSDVVPGDYFLTSILRWEGGPADGLQEQRLISVSEQGGRKYARMKENAQPVPIKMQ